MADLIIKPSSGNNLVVQGGDSSPAITVANTGTTTFAENATFSGTANNLGTATAGTLSSGVTFPAGHVIQVKYNSATQQTVTTTSTSWQYHTGLDIPITRTAGTKLLIQVMGGVMDGHVATRTFPIDIARSDGLTWSGTNLARFGDSSNGISCPQYGTEYSRYSVSYGCIDTTSTSSAYTYRPTWRSNDTGSATFQTDNGGTMFIVAMEFMG